MDSPKDRREVGSQVIGLSSLVVSEAGRETKVGLPQGAKYLE